MSAIDFILGSDISATYIYFLLTVYRILYIDKNLSSCRGTARARYVS